MILLFVIPICLLLMIWCIICYIEDRAYKSFISILFVIPLIIIILFCVVSLSVLYKDLSKEQDQIKHVIENEI